MKKTKEIIFYNKDKISVQEKDDKFNVLDENQKKEYYQSIEKEIEKKDKARRICSHTIFFTLAILAIIYGIFGKKNQTFWFFLFLLVFAVCWALLYFILGLFCYKKIEINWHFKDFKSPLDNKCIAYAGSHYRVYVDKYSKYLGNVDFTYTPNANKKRRKMVGFAKVMPSKYKGIIFNGKIKSNIPYFAFYMRQGKKLCFFPGFVLYLAGKDTKVISYSEFVINKVESDSSSFAYHKVELGYQDKILATFYISNNFNMNFFNFKF